MCTFRHGNIVFCPAVLGTIDGTAAAAGSTPADVAHHLLLRKSNPDYLIETIDFFFQNPRQLCCNN